MTIARFIRLFKERLNSSLAAKTAWGRNEIEKEVDRLIGELLLEALEEV